jgi:long-chain acyl-CoA synthetase
MGAMLTHAGLYRNAQQMRLWAPEVKPGHECVLAVLPLTHVFGMTGVMNYGLTIGAEIALLPRFKTGEVLKLIEQKRPSILFAVPTMFAMFNSHPEIADQDLTSLRYCISGGAGLPADIKSTFESLTGCRIVEGYGLSETGPVCTVNPFDGTDRDGSVGLPVPGTVVKLVSLDNPNKPVRIGERGEVCVSGPQVMAGYWLQKDETEAVMADGFLRTGDIGYLDTDGFLYLTGRAKNLIISGGFNVYPRMVEEAILHHPVINAVAVCGIPDQQKGENVKAYVVLRDGAELTARALRGFLRDKIAPYEMPRKVEFVDEFPDGLAGTWLDEFVEPIRAEAAE